MVDQQKKNRLFIIAIFALSIIPVLGAWFLYLHPAWFSAQTNYGQLVTPAIPSEYDDYLGFDAFSEQNIAELKRHWLLVNVINKTSCSAQCLDAILKTRQIRLMLNKDLSRTRRVVLITESLPEQSAQQLWLKDSVLWRLRQAEHGGDQALLQQLLNPDQPVDEALLTRLQVSPNELNAPTTDLIRVKPSSKLMNSMSTLLNAQQQDGLLLLIDPVGNIMMTYPAGFDPYKVKNDLMHLLRISQIG